MRLALLSPLPPEQTGIAEYAAHCRRALNGAGVEVLTPMLGQRPLQSLAAARRWVAERDWSGIDVVHAELGGGRLSEFHALCALAALPGRPALSATVHDPERLVWRPVSWLWQQLDALPLPRLARQALAVLCDPHTLWAERRLARQLDGLVTLTDTGANRLAARMRIARSQVSVVPHGVLDIAPRPLPPGPPEGPVRVLYFGYIYSGKGIEDLLDAVARLRPASRPGLVNGLRLTIAGGTSPDIAFGSQGSYLEGLRALVDALGLREVVDWELDVDTQDVPALIQRHHVMVLPYRESRKLSVLGQMRGTSGALAWAIACGRGAITSDARAFAEEIRGGNGRAYPQGDVAALAEVLAGLAAEPAQAAQWAGAAADLARQRAWPVTGERLRAHFDTILQRRGRGRAPRPRTAVPVQPPRKTS